ncbi:DUF6777 domain-containing protein [Streptomyces sp. NBC_01497]|uniref:DUF6777 domain-containing protein n=1 Tax=Streptomyces sp. NBC_01497 TaxID=2903885 RepID=UPI002E35C56F|nr:DUF6777 domain-containing protein [Streptomyces sp. NBC_01497]
MRSPIRRRTAALAALSVGVVFTAGCGGGAGAEEAASARQLFFQPAATRGPDPFTPSTVSDTSTAAPSPSAPASPDAPGTGKAAGATRAAGAADVPVPATAADAPAGSAARAGGQARTLPGDTPGVYGGTQGASNCDVERQVRLLTENTARSAAFATGARVGGGDVPGFLRGLTPVVLRADTRVTSHGYRNGAPTSYQAVLQAGTAVLADDRGVPRVRCSCGNPLGPAVAMEGAVAHRGTPWHGYRPDHVLLISRAARRAAALTIVNRADNTWMQRTTGTDGDQDGIPASLPPYSPDADLFDPQQVTPPDPTLPDTPSDSPSAEPTGTAAPEPSGPAVPPAPTDEPTGGPDAPLPSGQAAAAGDAPPPDGPGTPDGDPPVPDAPQATDVLTGPAPVRD